MPKDTKVNIYFVPRFPPDSLISIIIIFFVLLVALLYKPINFMWMSYNFEHSVDENNKMKYTKLLYNSGKSGRNILLAYFESQKALDFVIAYSEGKINYRDSNGNTALLNAISNKWVSVIELILPKCHLNDLNLDGTQTPLSLAIELKLFGIAEKLLEKGAEVNVEFIETVARKSGFC